MATSTQKTTCTIIGMIAGAITGYALAKNKEDRLAFALGGAALGGLGGYGFAHLLKEPCDTVNYTCYRGGKIVYVGICYADRKQSRMQEHCTAGKKFTHVKYSRPKPRSQAKITEKRLIQKYQPFYNIQHNIAA